MGFRDGDEQVALGAAREGVGAGAAGVGAGAAGEGAGAGTPGVATGATAGTGAGASAGATVIGAMARRRRRPTVRRPLPRLPFWRVRLLSILAVLGPGLVSGFADNDAGGITTYSIVGARWGYSLLWVILTSQVVLFFTQEVGARLGLATGKGLMGLIRERWGVRWGAFAALTMLAANLGSTVAEFAGIGSALSLFGIPPQISAAVAAVVVVAFIALGSYSRVQYLFVGVGVLVSVAYVVSASLARPDWGAALTNLVSPQLVSSPLYWLAVVGTVGTTITPWGQAFIQSYVADKGLRPEDLTASRVDVFAGALLTNVIAGFIVVACAATLWTTGQTTIASAADAAQALRPLAGPAAATLFAVGLLGASFLGLGVVPLTSAYTTCEAFGWETGVNWNWREAPAFYGLLAFFIGFAALFVMIPGLPLIQVMFAAQVLNAVLLPFILVFVMLLAGDRTLLGPLASGRVLLTIGWVSTGLLVLLSLVLVVTSVGGG
ncbi:MAG: Nramp family divalent metal transporter [Chloroflexi bacterium]|nr:Nramp family divalent metal transporter [Chloroflexota bacterium]